MPLLSGMMRSVAITGDADRISAWCTDRQGGRWAEQTVRAAFKPSMARARAHRPPADPAAALGDLTALRDRGDISQAEFERLRARVGI